MDPDEQSIRSLIDAWMSASKAGDVNTVLQLMTDDVLFHVPGKEPFGKEAFAAASNAAKGVKIDGHSDIQEIKILGDWAWLRNRLRIVVTLPDGKKLTHAGYVLTILRKSPAGQWQIARDANLLTVQSPDVAVTK